jgi:hypothetical protein
VFDQEFLAILIRQHGDGGATMKDFERSEGAPADVKRRMAPCDLLFHSGKSATLTAEPFEGVSLSRRLHCCWKRTATRGRFKPRDALAV